MMMVMAVAAGWKEVVILGGYNAAEMISLKIVLTVGIYLSSQMLWVTCLPSSLVVWLLSSSNWRRRLDGS